MKHCKKHISIFLLLIFTWVVVPPFILHKVFANHEDTECLRHSTGIEQLESLHKHCDIFKTNSLLYDAPELMTFEKPISILISELQTEAEQFHLLSAGFSLKSRGPPVS